MGDANPVSLLPPVPLLAFMMISYTSVEIRGAGWPFLGLTCSYISLALRHHTREHTTRGWAAAATAVAGRVRRQRLLGPQTKQQGSDKPSGHSRHGEGLQGVLVKVGDRDPGCQLQNKKGARVRCAPQLLGVPRHSNLTSA